jgi:hypothetical protein
LCLPAGVKPNIRNEEAGKITYKNGKRMWTRWKIGDGHNNVLKTRGYNPGHNEVYGTPNAPGFWRTGYGRFRRKSTGNPECQLGGRRHFSRPYDFRRFSHKSREDSMVFVLADEQGG